MRKPAASDVVKRPFENAGWYALILGLAAVLVILAFLEYRSSRQLSNATSERMRTILDGALTDMRSDIENEFLPVCLNLQGDPAGRWQEDLQDYTVGFARWRRTAENPALVTNVIVWRSGNAANARVLRLDTTRNEFVGGDWLPEMAGLRQRLQEVSVLLETPAAATWAESKDASQGAVRARTQDSRQISFPCLIDEHVPALLRATMVGDASRDGKPREISWIIAQLNTQVLAKQIFPELTKRYFSGNDGLIYQVAVLRGSSGQPPIYSSDAGFGSQAGLVPDATLDLFGPPFSPKTPGSPTDSILPSLDYSPGEHGWLIIAQHRKGSLEAAVASIFHWDLAINLGVLVVLAITMGLIIVASARARRLAQLQVDFVAGVSHELRTPITGIVSAAQNIADGLVENKDQMARYGKAIVGQAKQLSELIEQILMFSAAEKGRQRYHLQPADVSEVIDTSLKNMEGVAHSAGVRVERMIEPDLPQINVDFRAFCQCLQNLIANAIKYGGEKCWARVRAFAAVGPDGKKQVHIAVEDKGIGIAASDLKMIFEPFYRTAAVTKAQIHGSGLGLPLAKEIAEAMGGSLTVESVLGQGSTFTIHLPVQERSAVQEDAGAQVNSAL